MIKKRKERIAATLGCYACCCLIYYIPSVIASLFSSEPIAATEPMKHFKGQRHLLSIVTTTEIANITEISNTLMNCTPPDIEQFPRPLMDYETRRNGGLIVHILVSLYMFLGLAIICDEYFVPSLEKICKKLNMQSDVAGATFMAAGSSAPELATAIIAVFIAKDDIGIGTVVGSAVFNIAFVIGICGLLAGRVVHLNWWPMFRDCIFYSISILALLFTLYDESVSWMESVLFLVLYIAYILFMFVNRRVEQWITKLECLSFCGLQLPEPSSEVSYHRLPSQGVPDPPDKHLTNVIDFSATSELSSIVEEPESSIFSPPVGCCQKFLWAASLPLLTVCYITVPDCRRKRWEKWFYATFIFSIAWIGVLSYLLVWMITIIGFTLHIKDTIMKCLCVLCTSAARYDAL